MRHSFQGREQILRAYCHRIELACESNGWCFPPWVWCNLFRSLCPDAVWAAAFKRLYISFKSLLVLILLVLSRTLSILNRSTCVGSQLSSFLLLAFLSSWALRAHPFLHSELTAVASMLLFPAKLHEKEAKKPMLIVTVIKSQVWTLSQGSAWVKSQAQ